jgi:hypothetical protein
MRDILGELRTAAQQSARIDDIEGKLDRVLTLLQASRGDQLLQ